MRLTLLNNPLRNLIKDVYYRFFFYKIPIKWGKDYLTAKLKNGEVIKLVYSRSTSKGAYNSRYYSAELISILRELKAYLKEYKPKKGDVVIDAGAYEGGITVLFGRLVGDSGRVIAFEPSEEVIGLLRENLRLNGIKNVLIVEKGLWDKEETLYFKADNVGGHICGKEEADFSIKGTNLDSELKKLKIPYSKINFIKMDIEGAEIEAIKGARDLMKKGNPYFAIASYHIVDGEKTYKRLVEFFKKQNYKVSVGYPYHLTTWAHKQG